MSDPVALPKAQEARPAKAAAKVGASPRQLGRKAITAHLGHLAWRERAIRASFGSGEMKGRQSTDEVFAAIAGQPAWRVGEQAA